MPACAGLLEPRGSRLGPLKSTLNGGLVVTSKDALQLMRFLLQYWSSRSPKVDDFHLIRKGSCHFLLVINTNLGPIFHRFRDTFTCSLKLFIENCGRTAADGDIVTIDSLQEVASALSDGTIADPYDLSLIHIWRCRRIERCRSRWSPYH